MRVPFLDLQTQYTSIKEEILEAVNGVLDTSQYILGPRVAEFERNFAAAHNVEFGVAVSNGTAALHLALWAAGVKSGDEVIVPVNTFIATAEAVVLCGARPVFVDHDTYYNIDVASVESKITNRTRAIIPVHLYGQPANMEPLREIADRRGILLIEDAAQAHLAKLNGKYISHWSLATCFSFYPGKNLGAYGEGGMVLTNDSALDKTMRLLRDHGSVEKYNHVLSGHNYRLEALQGAILDVKLRYLAAWTDARRTNAARYDKQLSGIEQISIPKTLGDAEPVHHLYVVQAENRTGLRKHLTEVGIDTGLHYPIPLHMQPCFRSLGYKAGAFPNAERSADAIVSLPMYPELREDQIAFVADAIRAFYAHQPASA